MRVSLRAGALQESAIRKLDAAVAARTGVRFYRVNIGQPDVPTPSPLLAAIRAFQPTVVGYGPASGSADCRAAGAAYHARWCPSLTAADVAVTTGGSEALLFAFTAVADPGDEIIAPEPYYTNYNGFASVAGVRIVPVPTRIEDGFRLPSNATLDAACTRKTRAIVFSNPGNPTGAVQPRADLERLADWAASRGIFIISDEVYRRIWSGQPPTSMLELDRCSEHVICVDSMSKTYSACGLRLGFLISRNAEVMEKVERIGQARLGAQPLAQQVAIAALSLPEHYYAQVRETYARRVEALHTALSAVPGIEAHRPEGAFYLMARLPVSDTERFARFLVEEFEDRGESVVVAAGSGFFADSSRGRDLIRLAAVLEEDALRRAVDLLALGLEAYRSTTSF